MPHSIPPLIADHILEKISLFALDKFKQKMLSVVHIFSFIITAYLKKFIGSKSLSTNQCQAELFP